MDAASDTFGLPRSRRRGTSHAPPELRRAQILQAARRCFAESGYERARMDDVAHVCGLSKGSLYRFFASKDELLFALLEEFEARVGAALDDEAPPYAVLPRLQRSGATAVDLLVAHADVMNTWFEFFAHRGARERMAAVYTRWRRRLAAMVRAGVRAGELRAVVPLDAAAAMVAAIEGLVLQTMVDPRFDARRRWPGVWDVLERGLRREAS